jgi:hypothetical protein
MSLSHLSSIFKKRSIFTLKALYHDDHSSDRFYIFVADRPLVLLCPWGIWRKFVHRWLWYSSECWMETKEKSYRPENTRSRFKYGTTSMSYKWQDPNWSFWWWTSQWSRCKFGDHIVIIDRDRLTISITLGWGFIFPMNNSLQRNMIVLSFQMIWPPLPLHRHEGNLFQ